jgi:hypothetical protein
MYLFLQRFGYEAKKIPLRSTICLMISTPLQLVEKCTNVWILFTIVEKCTNVWILFSKDKFKC